jgi:hypothetical protein
LIGFSRRVLLPPMSPDGVPHVPLIVRWREQKAELMETGELVADPIDPPKIRPGVWLRSLRMRRFDGSVIGRGGIVYGRSPGGWDTVDTYFRDGHKVHLFRVADDDIDWMQYTGEVNVRDVEHVRREIAAAMAGPRNRHNVTLYSALGSLTSVLEVPARVSNADASVR